MKLIKYVFESPHLLSQLLQSVVLLPVGVLPCGDLDVGDVAVEVGGAALERRHQLVKGIQSHLVVKDEVRVRMDCSECPLTLAAVQLVQAFS